MERAPGGDDCRALERAAARAEADGHVGAVAGDAVAELVLDLDDGLAGDRRAGGRAGRLLVDRELRCGPGVDQRTGARARRLRPVGYVRAGDGSTAGGLQGDGEDLGAGDEGRVGRRRGCDVARSDVDRVCDVDDVPVRVDGVDGRVERGAGRLVAWG